VQLASMIIFVASTIMMEGMFGVRHDTDTCDYVQLIHFCKSFTSVSVVSGVYVYAS